MERSHLESFILVWLHHNDEPVEQQMKDLKSVIKSIEMFVDIDTCVNFITNTLVEKIFVILPSSVSEHLVPIIHGLPQVYTIYCLMYPDCSLDHYRLMMKEELSCRILPLSQIIKVFWYYQNHSVII
jgi:hypothetical protein